MVEHSISFVDCLKIVGAVLGPLVSIAILIINRHNRINRWKNDVVKKAYSLSSSMRIGRLNVLLDTIVKSSEGILSFASNPITVLDEITGVVTANHKELVSLLNRSQKKYSNVTSSFQAECNAIVASYRQCIKDIVFLVKILDKNDLNDVLALSTNSPISDEMQLSLKAAINNLNNEKDRLITNIIGLRFIDRVIPDFEQQLDLLVNDFFRQISSIQKEAIPYQGWFFIGAKATPESQFDTAEELYEKGKYTEAIKWYKKAADQGLADAQFRLGECFEVGRGCKKDLRESFIRYESAAKKGLPIAEYKIGKFYEEGLVCEKDAAMAVHWYESAAFKNYSLAQYEYGLCYLEGRGVNQDTTKGTKWIKSAATKDCILAQTRLGAMLLFSQNDSSHASYWLKKAAENGDLEGMMYYAFLHLLKKDTNGFLYWCERDADEGFPVAQAILGMCYLYGIMGCEENIEKGIRWTASAAEAGISPSQYVLGRCYMLGEGVKRDFHVARDWIMKAISNQFFYAYFGLAIINYKFGHYSEAVENLQIAAQAGSTPAIKLLGQLYKEGLGTGIESSNIANFYFKTADELDKASIFDDKSFIDPYAKFVVCGMDDYHEMLRLCREFIKFFGVNTIDYTDNYKTDDL